jgi:predicted RNA-binding Zn-ribbon protein involved in translation (DUF1610 family)
MEGKKMGQIPMFKVDLTQIEGDGEFPCPSCGGLISPDDESEVTYEVTDIKTREEGSLETLNIICKNCGSTILIGGFEALNGFNNLDELDKF